MSLVLASASPRRSELLRTFGIPFVIRPPHVDECLDESDPMQLVTRLGEMKARAVVLPADQWIIAADTIVTIDDIILGKPRDREENRQMLQMLSGRAHRVYGGIALLNAPLNQIFLHAVCTSVRFRKLTTAMVDNYVASADGLDKAGGYGIQGSGAVLVESIDGCYDNVVGLSRSHLYQMMAAQGFFEGKAEA
ncbi:Maf family protein [Desulfurispirillum indicum]|uniref:dTTP/UTP pyrophosphatase n=1 Tax=Desulfurispirillum indicum (strain ATCC BAA-1389 / DSM 22839 / S5) TaxID=653733 RepID=E6W1C7_DESIS|nr:Maf family protein [Desulfurispirillum indicum]ADU65383.1 maf protein [Desulfurispirillum indicum S5]UCZ57276.1 Maf family protein [Desulfurispirillum indicum]